MPCRSPRRDVRVRRDVPQRDRPVESDGTFRELVRTAAHDARWSAFLTSLQFSTHGAEHQDPETENLAREVAAMTGETKTGAIAHRCASGRATDASAPGGNRERALRALPNRRSGPRCHPGPGTRAEHEEQDAILGYEPRRK